ncbi:MAG: sigma-54-dependent Fis family transcriptional regulator, partial [Deltaproteobacteria bacterium]
TINMEHLPSDVREWATAHPITRPPRGSLAMQEATRIQEALEKCGGNRIAAAKELGISRTTLWRKIKKYGLD